jgi:hypothetical protein
MGEKRQSHPLQPANEPPSTRIRDPPKVERDKEYGHREMRIIRLFGGKQNLAYENPMCTKNPRPNGGGFLVLGSNFFAKKHGS